VTVRAVLFDFYGTLAPGRTDEAQARVRAAQSAALGVDAARFDAEMTATVDERFRGAGGDVAGSLAWVAARIGASPSPGQLAAAAQVRLAGERSFGEPRTDAVAVLSGLRARGLRTGVISDCSAELPLYFPQLPVAPFIDAPVFSFVTGHRKPDPAIYLACCERLGVAPEECLYVGDGGSDELAGARRLGMRAVWLDVAAEQGGVVYGRHAAWDGERISSLTEVASLLTDLPG
jgi:putative hydrolase of the HAD superfamily